VRIAAELELREGEREQLKALLRSGLASVRLAQRATQIEEKLRIGRVQIAR